jgi:hypothetical protein
MCAADAVAFGSVPVDGRRAEGVQAAGEGTAPAGVRLRGHRETDRRGHQCGGAALQHLGCTGVSWTSVVSAVVVSFRKCRMLLAAPSPPPHPAQSHLPRVFCMIITPWRISTVARVGMGPL